MQNSYDQVMRSAFNDELAKLAHSAEMAESLAKISFQLGSMKDSIGYVPGMMSAESKGLAPAVAASRAAAAAAAKPGLKERLMAGARKLFGGGGSLQPKFAEAMVEKTTVAGGY